VWPLCTFSPRRGHCEDLRHGEHTAEYYPDLEYGAHAKYGTAPLQHVEVALAGFLVDPDKRRIHRAAGLAALLARVDGDPASLPRPAPEDVLRTWQVGKAVGNVENDGVELIEPYAPAEPTLLQRQRYRNLRASRVPSHPEVPEMRDDEIAIEQVAKELWQKIIQCGYTVCHDTVNNRPWFTCGSNLDCS
jgi:hypothetical protein